MCVQHAMLRGVGECGRQGDLRLSLERLVLACGQAVAGGRGCLFIYDLLLNRNHMSGCSLLYPDALIGQLGAVNLQRASVAIVVWLSVPSPWPLRFSLLVGYL